MSFEDPEIIIKAINIIQNIINIPEMDRLLHIDFEDYENKLKSIFPQFSKEYPVIFNMIIKKEDITYLYSMFDHIRNIKTGKINKEDCEKVIGEELAEKYLYPVVDKTKKNKK